MSRAGVLGVVALVMTGACSSSPDPPGVDGGGDAGDDGGPDRDGGDGNAGLGLAFASDPDLPGDLVGVDFPTHVEEVRIELSDLRALGDSATGEGTTRDELELRWGDEGGDDETEDGDDETEQLALGEEDAQVFFANAPPGVYSHANADVTRYRVRGTIEIDAEAYRFEIDDSPPTSLAISIPLGDFLLEAGTVRTIAIQVAIARPVGDVPWDEVASEGGDDLRLEEGSDQIDAAREGLRQAFSVAGAD
jgi:hypothetical protein